MSMSSMTNESSRSMPYSSRTPEEALAWQRDLRAKLFSILKMDDLLSREAAAAFSTETMSSEKRGNYALRGQTIDSTPGRRIEITATVPTNMKGPFPAVVAVDGHSGTRQSCYEPGSNRAYAHVLAEKGYVTVSTRISQHDVQDESRILMGERLWDLMRCVDFLVSLDEVDSQRIGCAGLSLGGEMTMWLAAMDERIQATISAGFLTRMDQLEAGHCMCWKFPGLRNLVDFTDIYSLIAPRALLCQNGLKEDPSWFPVSIAREAIEEIKVMYADMECPQNVSLVAHDGGHEIDLPSLLSFFDQHLQFPAHAGKRQ